MRKGRLGVALMLGLAIVAALGIMMPAHAADRIVGAVVGNGTISPGLPITGCNTTTHSFDSITITYAGVRNTTERVGGTINVAGGGNSGANCENAASGKGTGTVNGSYNNNLGANPGSGSINCPYSYTRTAAVVQVSLTCNLTTGPLAGTSVTGPCVFAFEPTNAAATAYQLQGVCTAA